MTRYQVFLPPVDSNQLSTNDASVCYRTLSFALPENSYGTQCGGNAGPSLGSPFSSLNNSLLPSSTNAVHVQDVTFNYTGAVDFGSQMQSQFQSPERSGRVRSESASQDDLPATEPAADLQDSSYDTTTSSTLPPSNINQSSSLGHIPQYRLPMNRLTPLSRLMAPASDATRGVVSVLLCVVQVDEPKTFRTEDDKRNHREGSGKVGSWSVVMAPSPESGEVGSQITFWGRWAEVACEGQVRRGDVVLLENASYTPTPKPTISMSDRAQPPPSLRVLYRTLPRYETTTVDDYRYKGFRPGLRSPEVDLPATSRDMLAADRALRPDMRLGRSDVAIRKVGELAQWFAAWVGGEAPIMQ